MKTPERPQETPDFSLVLGGPLFQAFVRTRLAGPALELVHRRILFVIAVFWLPALVLSALDGHLVGGSGLSFLRDIETHVRLLIAVPVLVLAEPIVHQRIRPMVGLFLKRGIVTAEDSPRFIAAIDAINRVRNSMPLELALLTFVFTVGRMEWADNVAMSAATWYAAPDASGLHLTLPGYWFAWVSVPLSQFILLRWYLRLVLWFALLWRVSRLNLRLVPTHPDGAGGIGFLENSVAAFSPIVFAQSAMLAAFIAGRILYEAEALPAFYPTIAAFVGFFLLLALAPLAVFTPKLARTKRLGLQEYGTLATSYVEDFERKWIGHREANEEILGTADIQSLADLDHGLAVVRAMSLLPFSMSNVRSLAVAAAVPLLPLALTVVPINELLKSLVKIVF